MIKELEEAQGAIIDIIFTNRTTNVAHELADQILNLKGENWRIAIVRDKRSSGLVDGFGLFWPEVIWWAGDEKENCS